MDGPALTTGDTLSVEEYCARLHAAAVAAVNEVAGRIQDSLHESLNTPYPPASQPGERPHRRTGNLAAGITLVPGEEEATADVLYTRASGNPAVPQFLEYGTTKMSARPAVTPEREIWKRECPGVLVELINGEMSNG